MGTFLGDGTIRLDSMPSITSFAAVVGKTEGEGPLASTFDEIFDDISLGEKTWERSESRLQMNAFQTALSKGNYSDQDIDFLFAGDLLNQCTASNYGLRNFGIPYIGLFGACSTMAETLSMAALFIENGYGNNTAAVTSSHFCSAERQFRLPLNYGGQRTPTAQWTVTGAGAAIVSPKIAPPYIREITVGKIVDQGIKDAANMGAAMAGAASDTISRHFKNTGSTPKDYDLILSGDLGLVGSAMTEELLSKEGIELGKRYKDCGLMIFDREKQDVHAGGSGCGCSASVLCGHVLTEIQKGHIKNVLFVATGALMSPTIIQQGESIPSIAHAVRISFE